MNKVIKNKINKALLGLGMLGILGVGVIILPAIAAADIAGYVAPYGSTSFNNSITSNNQYNSYQTPGNTSVYPSAPTLYYPNTNSSTSNTDTSNTRNTSNNYYSSSTQSSNSKTGTDNSSASVSNLASTAVFGSNTFYPSGLIEWVFFAILILLAVIIVRRISGAKRRYQETPLKHA